MRKESYRRYDYDSDIELITRTEQIEDYLDSKFSNISVDTDIVKDTIETTIDNSMQDVKNGICGVNCHIENAKNEIINNMSCGVNPCVATKQDIADAVTKINAHTDEKFNEVDFLKQFSDLNEQIKNIKTTNL